jgi:nucleoside-diphosphate-sugar epimerase
LDRTILLTGAAGLIGTRLAARLLPLGTRIIPVDLRTPGNPLDLRDHARMAELAGTVDGIVHLGAVSRVIDGQNDPELCRAVNVEATRNLLSAALASPRRPWFIYASSREVYGQQDVFPVPETAEYRPLNVYARSKVNAELLCAEARAAGLSVATVRFSSVYGSAADHATRVVPAFLRAGVAGSTLRVDGKAHTFDLTHVDDVSDGVKTLIGMLDSGERFDAPLHFVTGVGVTLLSLAERAVVLGGGKADITIAAPRTYDIHHFVGDPGRTAALLGWRASTPLDAGLARLAGDLAARHASQLQSV